MLKAPKKFLLCIVITTLPIFSIVGRIAQVRKRLICGKVVSSPAAGVTRTVVSLFFGPDGLLPGAAAEQDGTFCIENYVSDLSKSTSARLYVTSFCRPDDVTLVDVPFWPRLRGHKMFSGKRIIIGPGSRTSVGDVNVQFTYGHVTLRLLDEWNQPLLTHPDDWSPVWIRVRDHNGVTVHASGLSVVEIEQSVDLKESRINLALPKGKWTLEVALAGVPPGTSTIRRAVRWRRVPGELKIESCREPVEVNLSVTRTKRS